MSLPTFRQAYAFLTPLKRKNSVFMVTDRECDVATVRFILRCLSTLRRRVMILDTSATVGTSALQISDELNAESLKRIELQWLPEEGPVELHLATIVEKRWDAVLIDDMNALHHLLSRGQERLGMHRLFILARLLSYSARASDLIVISTVYSNASSGRQSQMSLASTGDVNITVEFSGHTLIFRSADLTLWSSGLFTVNV